MKTRATSQLHTREPYVFQAREHHPEAGAAPDSGAHAGVLPNTARFPPFGGPTQRGPSALGGPPGSQAERAVMHPDPHDLEYRYMRVTG
jgi:hypothetical protein